MDKPRYQLHIRKDAFKFSAAHMTVFPDGNKEPLHGHNYQVSLNVSLSDASFKQMVSFSVFKEVVKPLCDAWDEKILVQGRSPMLKGNFAGTEYEFTLCGKRYVFPADEVAVLDIENISTELLAEEFMKQMLSKLKGKLPAAVLGMEVRVDETNGQGASYFHWFD